MSAPQYDAPPTLITTLDGLDELISHLLTFERVAIDTESDNFYRYHRKVCLLQLTAGGRDYIVDPLATGALDPLTRLLTSPDVEKVFHGGENDLGLFYDTMGVKVTLPLFDTYIAAQVAGEQKVGFGALVGAHFGFKLDKRFQLHDWARRPLSSEAIDYARGDTHFLLPLRDKVWEQVLASGREEHALEEFERMTERISASPPFEPDSCLRLKGVRGLDTSALKVLRQLYVLREERASQLDLAPFRVLSNEHVVSLARSRPRSRTALDALPLSRDRGVQRLADALVAAVNQGMQPDAPAPEPPPRGSGPPEKAVEDRFNSLRRWRQAAADTLGLAPGLVAPNATLMAIASARPADLAALGEVTGVRRWQVKEFGETWLSILASAP